MSYLPRPNADRVKDDVDVIYQLTVEQLQKADTSEDRRKAFQNALRSAYDAGVDAQREIVVRDAHERPTPVPPPPDEDDPGMLPEGPRPQIAPSGAFQGRSPLRPPVKPRGGR